MIDVAGGANDHGIGASVSKLAQKRATSSRQRMSKIYAPSPMRPITGMVNARNASKLGGLYVARLQLPGLGRPSEGVLVNGKQLDGRCFVQVNKIGQVSARTRGITVNLDNALEDPVARVTSGT